MENKVPASNDPWKILVVDDERDVHVVTRLALESLWFDEKPVQLLDAYSMKDAVQVIEDQDDLALLLVDVVMETNDAGLKLVQHIRQTLKNRAVQIVLRTGYPGSAPERHVIEDYDINDYWEKTDLTAEKLYTLVVSGLRSYQNYMALEAYSKELKMQIAYRKKVEREKDRLIEALKQSAAEINTLTGLLPICSLCKRIRDDMGNWNKIETYICKHTQADVSHSLCPDCAKKYYADYDVYE